MFLVDNDITAIAFDILMKSQKIVSANAGTEWKGSNAELRELSISLIAELMEMINELGWKSWKDPVEMTEDQKNLVVEEFADVISFVFSIAHFISIRTGLTAKEIADAYFVKANKNMDRFSGRKE
jgi:NTP pyrophosphatase (non-canonical NTP hydrolase)